MLRAAAPLLVGVGLAVSAPAQASTPTAWQLLDDGDPTPGGWLMVYDTVRNRPVLLTEAGISFFTPASAHSPQTWELVGEDWVRRFIPEPTPVNSGGCAAFDTARGVMVVFGAFGNNETWEYDGTTWTKRTLPASPPARADCGMAYDISRGVTVMFGGWIETGAVLGDQWEYDGTTWTQRTFSTMPSARAETAMSYDPDRSVVVLFGGSIPGATFFPDTWEYDGARWRTKTTQSHPSVRGAARMAYHPVRQRTVLYGGYTSLGAYGDTWEWDGTRWTQIFPADSPGTRRNMALVWDAARGKIVGFGGEPEDASRNDTWAYDGATWTRIAVSGLPPVRSHLGLAHDPTKSRLVLYGGRDHNVGLNLGSYSDTWIRDDEGWHTEPSAGETTSSYGTPLVFDEARGAVRGFSGAHGQGAPAWKDVHELSGTPEAWTSTPYCCPQPDGRVSHTMAWAPGVGGVAVYGGIASPDPSSTETYYASDFWFLDGTTWTQVVTTPSPGVRWYHGMTYDSLRERVVLYGGHNTSFEMFRSSDTWVYDGQGWTQLLATSPPGERRGIGMAYDAARDRVVLFGNGPNREGVTWEFDGTQWVAMPTTFMPDEHRCWTPLAYDSKREVTWLFGGQNCQGQGYFNDTWAYGADPDEDGIVGKLDNCRQVVNSDQANGDGDAAGDVCDCAAADPMAFAAPQPVTGLSLSGSEATTLNWTDQAPAVGTGVRYDVASGALSALRAGSVADVTCLASQTALTSATDSRIPTVDDGYWYLVRARNVCGIGTYGAASLDAASPCP